MPRDPLAWLPLLRHWTHCLGEGPDAIARMGDLAALPELVMAALLPAPRPGGSVSAAVLRPGAAGAGGVAGAGAAGCARQRRNPAHYCADPGAQPLGDHALDRIAGTFADHPEAGVVGAAMWSADGRPQEVGGIVWADGQVWNHGRNAPPEHGFALAYERQCDTVSGCALAIRKELWQQLEGFDPRYRPAYAEDTDLCLRVRQAGHSVWVQPAARVLHLEGLSHSRSTEQGLKAHQVRNLEQLKQQWQHTLDTQQPPAGHPWLLAADRGLLGRPLALLLQPTAEAISTCRQRGYGVLALGESPQADVLGLPLGWRDLERWLLEQLPECGPEVVLVGSLEGAAGELAQRLQQARSEWALVAKPTELLLKVEAMQLPALPGWDRQELRILASSTGLHTDGWLETPSRLVIQLDVEKPISQVLKPGLNTVVVQRPKPSARSTVVIQISSAPLVQPANPSDQRRLMAVLAELELLQQHCQGFT